METLLKAPDLVAGGDVSDDRQIWTRPDFRFGDAPDQGCPDVIDVTGRVRDLVYGPYRALRSGTWRAVVALTVCQDAARRRLEVEFGVYPDFTRVAVPFGQPGRHELTIIHTLATGGNAEIRVFLARAAFHGELRFEGAAIERIGDAIVEDAVAEIAPATQT